MSHKRNYRVRNSYTYLRIKPRHAYFTVTSVGVAAVLSCVRPVIFVTPPTMFPSYVGTGFFVQYGTDVFFLTASHVHKNFDGDADRANLHILYNLDSREAIPRLILTPHTSEDPDDTDHADISCFYVPPEYAIGSKFANQMPFYLHEDSIVNDFSPGLLLHFKGLSPERSNFDYENRHNRINYIVGEAQYLRASDQKDMHILSNGEIIDMPSFDGLSGSPVFAISQPENPSTEARLAGMLLRGGNKSGRMHFVSAQQLLSLVDRCLLRHLIFEMNTKFYNY